MSDERRQDPKHLTEEQLAKYVPPDAAKEDYEFPMSVLVFSASLQEKAVFQFFP